MVVITYDISDNKKLNKVAKLLEQKGVRVQRSVFELDMKFSEAKKILKEIEKIIDEKDRVFLFEFKDKKDYQKSTDLRRFF